MLTVEVGGVFVADVSSEKNATYMSAVLIVFLILLVAYFLWRRYFGPRHGRVNVAIKKKSRKLGCSFINRLHAIKDLSEHLKRSTKAGV